MTDSKTGRFFALTGFFCYRLIAAAHMTCLHESPAYFSLVRGDSHSARCQLRRMHRVRAGEVMRESKPLLLKHAPRFVIFLCACS